MRIIFFAERFYPKVDGIIIRLKNTLEKLANSGCEVLLITANPACKSQNIFRFNNLFDVIELSGFPAPLDKNFCIPKVNLTIFKIIKNFNPDIVHLVGPVLVGSMGGFFAKACNLPVVASYHTDLVKYIYYYRAGYLSKFVEYGIRNFHRMGIENYCPSLETKEELSRLKIRNIHVWPFGIDHSIFYPDKNRSEFLKIIGHTSSLQKNKYILYAGRLSPEKQIHKFKEIFDHLSKEYTLLIAGDGEMKDELKILFKDINTIFLNMCNQNELRILYSNADVFILTSTTETLGFVILEAMACGSCVIGMNAGGVKNIIENKVNGFKVDPDDINKIIYYINEIVNKQDIRDIISKNAIQYASQFSWESATGWLLNRYTNVLRRFKK